MGKLLMPVEEAAEILDKYVVDANIVIKSFSFGFKDLIICLLAFYLKGWVGIGIAIAIYVVIYIYDLFFGITKNIMDQEKDAKEKKEKMTQKEREDLAGEYISGIATKFDLNYSPIREEDIIERKEF